ncbi:MAG TPA: zinc-ribbon domain-containing protein, partial [Arenibaculum sp.]|nr:zinc-ribbon domain-containing protein [Arenibaculum sp.]
MRQYRCENCGRPLYFANDHCGQCGARVGFIPHDRQLASFEVLPDGTHRRYAPSSTRWKPCANYTSACLCNWMVAAED